ncbi:DNA protecting protein DprA [Thermodesulfatator indicus DSM 15286]|uniref:DNA protecting protein DprA n=2 Tax=Thermodesulfatator indicus TaxID=171695 RepID=F8AAT4_THEID|nr:DNA protecting protein DprA [Thermodesulfatator indicus DSM 15286]
MISDNLTWSLALWLVPKMGPRRFFKLLNFVQNPEEVFSLPKSRIKELGLELPEKEKALAKAKNEFALVNKLGGKVISFFDEDYPPLLREISDPPPILYVLGNLPQKTGLAVVGSRRATSYGREVCRKWVSVLARAGIPIVSGLALGIDSMAHEAAVKENAPTYAVLGCGLDVNYPASNSWLRREIIAKGGGLITEFPLGTKPRPGNFPIRNRLISGLSAAVLVIEADLKSGSLITARLAAEQGREVLAVPGPVYSSQSRGTHALIRDGALLVDHPEQVLEIFSLSFLNEREELTLSEEEAKVLNCFEGEPLEFDELILKTGLEVDKLLQILTNLELEGLIVKQSGNAYLKVSL